MEGYGAMKNSDDNNFGFNSWNSWDPLKKCVVGSALPKDFFDDIKDPKVRDVMNKVNNETIEDLDNLTKELESRGVVVYRTPNKCIHINGKTYATAGEYIADFGYMPKPWNVPRDNQIILGNNMVSATKNPMDQMWHSFKPDPDNIFGDQIAPWSGCSDVLNIDESGTDISLSDIVESDSKRNPISVMSWPSILRVGRDLLVDVHTANGPTLQFAKQWIKKYNEKFGYNYRVNISNVGGHTDSLVALLRPGLLISHTSMGNYENTFPGWEVIEAPVNNEFAMDAWSKYKRLMKKNWRENRKNPVADYWIVGEETNAALNTFIDMYMADGVGSSLETNFDVNLLSVDPNTVIASGKSSVYDELDKRGIEVVTVDIRHRRFWDGGIHCVTLDLEREGACEDYFPNRPDEGIDFGMLWEDGNVTRR